MDTTKVKIEEVEVSAVVKRADGSTENLGVIAHTKYGNWLTRTWRKLWPL
jgi:hypothetical protein